MVLRAGSVDSVDFMDSVDLCIAVFKELLSVRAHVDLCLDL